MMAQQSEFRFLGSTFDERSDGKRLGKQLNAVKALMSDGYWRTLAEIESAVNAPQASVSARLRDCRRLGLTVERRARGERKNGLFEYRVSQGY